MKNSIITEKYLQEVFKHGEKELIMLVIKEIYEYLIKKGYTDKQLKNGEQFLEHLTTEAKKFYKNFSHFDGSSERALNKLIEGLAERLFILNDYSYPPRRVAQYMSEYPRNNIVTPYNEWREIKDLIEIGNQKAEANLDF